MTVGRISQSLSSNLTVHDNRTVTLYIYHQKVKNAYVQIPQFRAQWPLNWSR